MYHFQIYYGPNIYTGFSKESYQGRNLCGGDEGRIHGGRGVLAYQDIQGFAILIGCFWNPYIWVPFSTKLSLKWVHFSKIKIALKNGYRVPDSGSTPPQKKKKSEYPILIFQILINLCLSVFSTLLLVNLGPSCSYFWSD